MKRNSYETQKDMAVKAAPCRRQGLGLGGMGVAFDRSPRSCLGTIL